MKLSQIFMLTAISCTIFLSCGENLGERRKLHPNEQKEPIIKKPDIQKPAPKPIPDSTLRKNKKSKDLDTLKPSVATLD